MEKITRHDISKLFQNDKTGDIFADSEGGQGLILAQIEQIFTIREILFLQKFISSNLNYIQNFKQVHEHYPRIKTFIDKFLEYIAEISEIYLNFGKKEFIISLIKENKYEIHQRLKTENPLKSFLISYKKNMIKLWMKLTKMQNIFSTIHWN